jgi:uncharacterized protein YndB with AHSA1/START domain
MYQLSITQEFNAPVSHLFNAWRKPELLKLWFAPGDMTVPEAHADVSEGGNYRIVMQETDGTQHIVGGTYQKIIPNERMEFSWQWEGSPNSTHVVLLFKPLDDNRSSLELIHSEFSQQEDCDKHEMGWKGCLHNLPKALK